MNLEQYDASSLDYLMAAVKVAIQPSDWASWAGLFVFTFSAWLMIVQLMKQIKEFFEYLAGITENARRIGINIPLVKGRDVAIIQRQQFCDMMRDTLKFLVRAEDWRDQWFTDLEAEVEVEGRAFVSRFHRWLRMESAGSWREPSLMKAISKSTERRLLLVGEPGSGKSVALRHLGLMLAEEGAKSTAKKTRIPLYINLRSFRLDSNVPVSPTAIRDFIRGHFRSDDATTALYIRDHWDEYLRDGVWYFLFDSFDEIPAVMHAEQGSRTIQEYAKAIHDFITDMTQCYCILASREYKGPAAIPWPKLRILPLDNVRQLKLIDHTSLEREQSAIVASQLASPHSAMYRNPLLLSLLCRYVMDHRKAPSHNYGLLLNHLEKLSQRESQEFVTGHYGTTPERLMRGAEEVASVIAQDSRMGLAPTFGELADALVAYGYDRDQAAKLLNALIYVKIGRNDVKEAQHLEKRFAFSHRRYQETLFVRYLVRYPKVLSPKELLLDAQWREYTVTLLQSQDMVTCQPLIEYAIELFQSWSSNKAKQVDELISLDKSYYLWNPRREVHLLGLLHEGLGLRIAEVPDSLLDAIESFMATRWRNGDAYDQVMCIQWGGLVPQYVLQERIQHAVSTKVHKLRRASFEKVAFLVDLPEGLCDWVRDRVADETVVAKDRIELSKLDLLASRLPEKLGVLRVFKRCRQLRAVLYAPIRWLVALQAQMFSVLDRSVGVPKDDGTDAHIRVVEANVAILGPGFCITTALFSFIQSPARYLCIGLTLASVMTLCRFVWRSNNGIITPISMATSFSKGVATVVREMMRAKVFLLFLIGSTSLLLFATYFWRYAPIVMALVMVTAAPIVIGSQIIRRFQCIRRLSSLSMKRDEVPLILQARDSFEMSTWLNHSPDLVLRSPSFARSVLAILDDLPLQDRPGQTKYSLFMIEANGGFARQKDLILDYLIRHDHEVNDSEDPEGLTVIRNQIQMETRSVSAL